MILLTKIITMEGINAYKPVAGYELYKQNILNLQH
jgi:hypothetical protein